MGNYLYFYFLATNLFKLNRSVIYYENPVKRHRPTCALTLTSICIGCFAGLIFLNFPRQTHHLVLAAYIKILTEITFPPNQVA